MRPRSEADRRVRDVGIATTREDPGLRAVTELWRSFASPEHDLREGAASISAPTLVVWGKRDPVIPLKLGRTGGRLDSRRPARRSSTPATRPRSATRRASPPTSSPSPTPPSAGLPSEHSGVSDAHRWRSELLGEARTRSSLRAAALDYFERGEGPVLLFSHGWLANANLWRKVVDELAGEFRCLVLDLPLGSHRTRWTPTADLGPARRRRPDRRRPSSASISTRRPWSATTRAAPTRRSPSPGTGTDSPSGSPGSSSPPARPPTTSGLRRPSTGCPRRAADPEVLGQLLGALEDPADPGHPRRLRPPAQAPGRARGLRLICAAGLSRDPGVLRDVAKAMAIASTAPVREAGRAVDRAPPRSPPC